MIYKYGYRLRPPSIGTQPKDFIGMNRSIMALENYWGIVVYDRKLTEKEMFEYDLDLLEVEEDE